MDLGGKNFEKSPQEIKDEINASQAIQQEQSPAGAIQAPNQTAMGAGTPRLPQ